MDFASQFRIICSALTIASTFYLLLAIYSYRSPSFMTYKFYLIAYIACNALQAFHYNITTIIGGTWNNCFVMAARGSFKGPAAIGMSLVLCTQTYTILSFMFLFRYAKVRSPSLLGSLSNRSIILKVCLSLSISSLFFFSLPAFFFRPNSIAVDLIADYVRKVFNQGRDYAFQMSVVCYWEGGLHVAPNWIVISGLLGIYLAIIIYVVVMLIITILTMSLLRQRARSTKSTKILRHEGGHLRALWFQFCLNFVFIILNRVGWTTLPLLMNINYTQPLNRIFSVWCTYSTPLFPLFSNISLILGIRELRRWVDRIISRSNGRVQKTTLSGVTLSGVDKI